MAFTPTDWNEGIAPGISAAQLDRIEQGIVDAHAALMPTGAILAFGGSAAPTGYRLCNGDVVSRATFAALFAVLGTAYGAGDGSTTFKLPDLRQRFPLGKAAGGVGATLGGTGGAIDHAHVQTQHTHPVDPTPTTSGTPSATQPFGSPSGGSDVAAASHTHVTDIVSFNSGNNSAGVNTQVENPPFQVVNYIVKT